VSAGTPATLGPATADRAHGALLGLAVGDALGTTLEFARPGSFEPLTDMIGGGPFGLRPGEWTDDTSMALCLAESLVESRSFDPLDQLQRYLRWYRHGHHSVTGHCFDIGTTTRSALEAFERRGVPTPAVEVGSAGNGSIMRLAPVAIAFAHSPADAVRFAGESSRTTHGLRVCVDACRYWGALLVGALRGVPKAELLTTRWAPVPGLWEAEPLHDAIDAVAAGSFRQGGSAIRGSGFVVDSLEAALWAFASTDSFEAGALAAVNLGDDADTTGAVYGQIAGACYGVTGIPERWRLRLARRDVIARSASSLHALSSAAAGDAQAPTSA
jgi:ADP-ribosyl-[dinitrogen reductase] hydrolase